MSATLADVDALSARLTELERLLAGTLDGRLAGGGTVAGDGRPDRHQGSPG
jgi:hypothetical protein